MTACRPILVAPGEDGAAWAAAVGDPRWRASARLLKEEGPATVHRATLLGRDVVVKSAPAVSLADRLKLLAGRSRAHRHWHGANWLDAHWFPTAAPLALLRGPGPSECLVMQALSGRTLLEHLAADDLPVREQHDLAAELGAMAARMTDLGRYNRDNKPSNLIVERLESGRLRVATIDCVAILPVVRVGSAPAAADRMMAALVIEPLGVGRPPRRSLMLRALRARYNQTARRVPDAPADPRERQVRKAFCRAAWMRIAELVRAHGDPTPRVSPLPADPARPESG